MDCLSPPLREIPEGDWFCSDCLTIRQQHVLLGYYDESDSETIGSDSESSLIENGVWGTRVSNHRVSGMRSKLRRALESSSEDDLGGISETVDGEDLDDFVVNRKRQRHKAANALDTDSDNGEESMEIFEDRKSLLKKDPLIPLVARTHAGTHSPSPRDTDFSHFNFNLSSPDFRAFFSTDLSSPEISHESSTTLDPLLPSCAKKTASKNSVSKRGKEPASKIRRQLHKTYSRHPDSAVAMEKKGVASFTDVFETRSDQSDSEGDASSICSGYLDASRKDNDRKFKPLVDDDRRRLRNGSLYSYFGKSRSGGSELESETNRVLRSNSGTEMFQRLPMAVEDSDVSLTGTSSRASLSSRQAHLNKKITPRKKRTIKSLSLPKRRGKKRSRSTHKKKRRKSPRVCYSGSRDSPYTPPMGKSPFSLRSRQQPRRSTARTAANYTPRRNAMRSAVRESYKHDSGSEGLASARKLLIASQLQRRESLQRSPFRSSLWFDKTPDSQSIQTPKSGYSNLYTTQTPSRDHQSSLTPSIPHNRLQKANDLSVKVKKHRHPSSVHQPLTKGASSHRLVSMLERQDSSDYSATTTSSRGHQQSVNAVGKNSVSSTATKSQPSSSNQTSTSDKTSVSIPRSSPKKSRQSGLTTVPETPPSTLKASAGSSSSNSSKLERVPRKKLQLGLSSKGKHLKGRQLSSVSITPEQHTRFKAINRISQAKNSLVLPSRDLLGEIHQSLENLHSRHSCIEKNGRVVHLEAPRRNEQLNQRIVESPIDHQRREIEKIGSKKIKFR